MRIFEPQNGVRIKGFFILFLSFCPWPGYLFLSSPDFSSILDILFLFFFILLSLTWISFFYPPLIFPQFWISFFYHFFILFIILFLSFFYHFLSSCPLPGDPFPYHPVNFPEFWISFLNPFCILLSLTWISFLYPLVLDLDKKRIKKW